MHVCRPTIAVRSTAVAVGFGAAMGAVYLEKIRRAMSIATDRPSAKKATHHSSTLRGPRRETGSRFEGLAVGSMGGTVRLLFKGRPPDCARQTAVAQGESAGALSARGKTGAFSPKGSSGLRIQAPGSIALSRVRAPRVRGTMRPVRLPACAAGIGALLRVAFAAGARPRRPQCSHRVQRGTCSQVSFRWKQVAAWQAV